MGNISAEYDAQEHDVYIIYGDNDNTFDDDIKTRHPNAKKMESMEVYSSESAEKISAAELKQIILNSNLLFFCFLRPYFNF